MSAYTISLVILITALLAASIVPTSGGAIASYDSNSNSHNLIVGFRMPGDRLVLKENVSKNSGWLRVRVIEKTFTVAGCDRITMVEALDQKTNGQGAYASILKGGPGHSNVTMKFKSQRSRGINFVVQLYARP